MRRGLLLITVAMLGVLAGTALAAYVSTTSTGVSTFTTRAVTSKPVITGARITPDPACGVGVPVDTVRQSATFYACVESVTDAAGIASVTADLSGVGAGAAEALLTTGGPFGPYTYRSGPLTAGVPLDTGTTGAWAVRATNNNGDRSTLSGNTYNVRSYEGLLRGEFGTAAIPNVAQYYRLSDTGPTAPNLGSGGTATFTYQGTPTRRVDGAMVGSSDPAVRLNGTTDYLTGNRLGAIASNYSLEIWVKGTAASGGGAGTVWSDSAGLIDAGRTTSANDFGLALDATGRVVAGCGNGATIRTLPGTLNDGNWHHLVFTRVRTSGAIALYLDGVVAASATNCNTTAHTASGTIWIGRSHESGLFVTADLDQAALYSRVITPAEILDHYRLGTGTG